MCRRFSVSVILLVLLCGQAEAQVVFWNLENFFDSKDDPKTADEDFTPYGLYHHTYNRFEAKRNLIAKCMIAIGDFCGGSMPVIAGFAEVENRSVLDNLLKNTPLAKIDYRVIHRESPDPRGIDVALLYDNDRFILLEHRFIAVDSFATRDILYAKGVFKENCDTVCFFVNHWPSKRNGAGASDSRRQNVADLLKQAVDSVAKGENIVIMGDFNDTPDSQLISQFCHKTGMVNLSEPLAGKDSGSLKYKGKWELIDQFLVSPPFEQKVKETIIFRTDFLLEEDKSFLGEKPKRTYIGPRYNGGASDHLPILLCSKPHL